MEQLSEYKNFTPESLGNEKKAEEFRKIDTDPDSVPALVRETYKKMHANQTVQFGKAMREKWGEFNAIEMNVMEALERLNELVDESDPDLEDVPNSFHAFQTAETIRRQNPELEWLQVVGLVHDMGKVMGLVDPDIEQWGLVGDTYPVGCQPQPSVAFHKLGFPENPDMEDSRYNTKLGMYKENCGLEHVMMSWGHDEYMYRVLKNHPGMKIPEEGLFIIRYHSFYPLHKEDDYQHLLSEEDKSMVKWIKMFSKFDLYSKDEKSLPDIESLKDYYQKLVDKYIPGKIKF